MLISKQKMYSKPELRHRRELAYSARLQACLRRGSKEDLREANELIKVLAGDPEAGGLQAGEEEVLVSEMIAGVREQISALEGALEGKIRREVKYDGFVNVCILLPASSPCLRGLIWVETRAFITGREEED